MRLIPSLLSLLLVACETTTPSGHPLTPVEVVTPSAPLESVSADSVVAPAAAQVAAPDAFVITSDEMHRNAQGEPDPVDPTATSSIKYPETTATGTAEANSQSEFDALAALVEGPAPAPAASMPPAASPAPGPGASRTATTDAATNAAGGWPLTLVATVPNAQPPRAIIGLPGGEEHVVSPGSMIPEAGLVVMAIGQETVQLAEIIPAGDHALVRERVLQALR